MIQSAKYDLSGGSRRVGMRATDGPKGSLLSTFRNTSGGSGSQVTNKKQTGQALQASGAPIRDDSSADEEDELTSSKAPSVTTSPRGARIRRPTPVRDTNTSDGMDDSYLDIDDFSTPKQRKTRSSQAQESLHDEDTTPTKPNMMEGQLRDGDIIPTVWNSKKVETTEEREKETKRMLREKQKGRVNPQHMRGAGFDAESVRGHDRKPLPGSNWDTGQIRRKPTYKGKATFGNRNRSGAQAKMIQSTSLISDSGDESKEESKPETSEASITQPNRAFKDPRKYFPLPEKEDTPIQAHASKGFRNPQLEYPLSRKAESQSGNDSDDYPPKPQSRRFQDPTEKFKLPKKHQSEKPKPKAFIDPFSRKYNPSPEPQENESQTQSYYIDESNDEINSIKGLEKGGSKKRKASKAIDLSTTKEKWMGQDDSSADDVELFAEELQSSSQVRHMDNISLILEDTKLREQAKKRKAKLETADVCVLCNTILPLGTLDAWRYDDGELKSIRMAEWTEICDKHKAADLRKEWEKKGYPVIEWGGLKKRVEKYHQLLVDIVEDKVISPFREVFAMQQKETRGNAAMLLRRDVQLQYPGYYGPRGSAILLHEITMRLGSFIGDAAKKDRLIGQGGISAFIQTVLVPELGVRLIMEDMNVSEFVARKTLDASREIGEKLHFDDYTEDIYDEEDGPWFDINATQTPTVAKKKQGFLDLSDNSD